MAKKSSKGKLRGIIGNGLVMVFAVLALALMALPIMQSTGKTTGITDSLPSVFEYLGYISETDGIGCGTLVMFILVAIFASLLILSSIVGLIGAAIGNKKLNTTVINRILAIVLTLVALIGMILTIAWAAESSGDIAGVGVTYTAQAGAVLPLVFGLFATGCAFLTPSKKKA